MSDQVILFGGVDEVTGKQFDDTWAFDSDTNTWTELQPDTYPTKRGWHAMVDTPEIEAKSNWSEQQVREHLVVAAADALVLKLPLGRIEMGEEKLK